MSKLSTQNSNIVIGQRLSAVRALHGLSQVEFADRLALSPRAYQNYERGEREMPTTVLVALLEAFGTDPLWVLLGPGDDPRKITATANPDLLEQIVIGVETHLQRTGKRLPVAKKARLVKLLYTQFLATAKIDTGRMADMLALTA